MSFSLPCSSRLIYCPLPTSLQGDDGERPVSCRVELSSENDLFFHFAHTLDEEGYRTVVAEQKLMIEFPQYAAVLIKMLNNCIKDPERYKSS